MSIPRGKEQQIITVSSEDRFRGYGGIRLDFFEPLEKMTGEQRLHGKMSLLHLP